MADIIKRHLINILGTAAAQLSAQVVSVKQAASTTATAAPCAVAATSCRKMKLLK